MTTATADAPTALYTLHPRQAEARRLVYEQWIDEMLYGGAAGGGKSHFLRALAAELALLWPGSTIPIFRRSDSELRENHINLWMKEVDPYIGPQGGIWQEQRKNYVWPSPEWCGCPKGIPCVHSSVTAFRHVTEGYPGVYKYQGAEFAAMLVDEGGHFRGDEILYLGTRVRANREYQQHWHYWRPLKVITANPGGKGHQWLLENFVDPMPLDEELNMHIVEGPMAPAADSPAQIWTVRLDMGEIGRSTLRRAFVPAKLMDNPSIEDPLRYAAGLASNKETRERLLKGDWSYFEGKALKMLDPDIHYVDLGPLTGYSALTGRPKPPPRDWWREGGLDHGRNHPTACLRVVEDPEKFLICYNEYVSPGTIREHVDAIQEREAWDHGIALRYEADPQMFRKGAGVNATYSTAAEYLWLGEPPLDANEEDAPGIRLHMATGTRDVTLDILSRYLEPDPNRLFPDWHPRRGEPGAPLLFISRDCPATWRCLNGLRHPKPGEEAGSIEDVVKEDDDPYDALRNTVTKMQRMKRVQLTRRRNLGMYQLRRPA